MPPGGGEKGDLMKRRVVCAVLGLMLGLSTVNVQAADSGTENDLRTTGTAVILTGTKNDAETDDAEKDTAGTNTVGTGDAGTDTAASKDAASEEAEADDTVGEDGSAGTELETAFDESTIYSDSTPEEAKAARLAAARASLGTAGMFDYYHDYDAVDALYSSTYASYTSPGTAGDATDLYYILASLDFIDECNKLRAKHNLSALKVTDYLMACEEADVNWSKDNIAHAQQFNMGENLAWGYSDPFAGWYDKEKALYEAGTTDYEQIGHYLNIIEPYYTATGFAITELGSNPYGTTMGQSFGYYAGSDAYTTDEYRQRVEDYGNYLSNTLFTDVADTDKFYFDNVYWARAKQITSGTGNNRFSPDEDCTRGQIVHFIYTLKGKPAVTASVPFTDVYATNFFADAVSWAASNGITSGTGNGKFSPNSACTRGQAVQFLYNLAGRPEVTPGTDFTDVPASHPFARAITWAKENQITGGTGNGRFSPDEKCTRGQIVTFLRKYAEKIGV